MILHESLQEEALPHALWRERLAMRAAAETLRQSGRREGEAHIRDEICLLRPGEQPGPAGSVGLAWLQLCRAPLTVSSLTRVTPAVPGDIVDLFDMMRPGPPVDLAARLTEAALDAGCDPGSAAMLADAALAKALRWEHVVPILSLSLTRSDLALRGDRLAQACHAAILRATLKVIPEMAELARRAMKIRECRSILRAKTAPQVVARFLSRDALTAAMLEDLMTDRSARRICERLQGLGAIREMSGRDIFRIYGV